MPGILINVTHCSFRINYDRELDEMKKTTRKNSFNLLQNIRKKIHHIWTGETWALGCDSAIDKIILDTFLTKFSRRANRLVFTKESRTRTN